MLSLNKDIAKLSLKGEEKRDFEGQCRMKSSH